jgi:hypothetical protein
MHLAADIPEVAISIQTTQDWIDGKATLGVMLDAANAAAGAAGVVNAAAIAAAYAANAAGGAAANAALAANAAYAAAAGAAEAAGAVKFQQYCEWFWEAIIEQQKEEGEIK